MVRASEPCSSPSGKSSASPPANAPCTSAPRLSRSGPARWQPHLAPGNKHAGNVVTTQAHPRRGDRSYQGEEQAASARSGTREYSDNSICVPRDPLCRRRSPILTTAKSAAQMPNRPRSDPAGSHLCTWHRLRRALSASCSHFLCQLKRRVHIGAVALVDSSLSEHRHWAGARALMP